MALLLCTCFDNKTGPCFIEFKLAALIQSKCVVGPKYKEVIDAKLYHKVIPRFHFSTDDSKSKVLMISNSISDIVHALQLLTSEKCTASPTRKHTQVFI